MFCKYCGKALEDGQVCDCPQSIEEQAREEQAATAHTVSNTGESSAASQIAGQAVKQLVTGTKGLIKRLIPLFKSPVTEQEDMINSKNVSLAVQMFVLHTVVNTLLAIASLIWLRIDLGEYAKYMEIPYFRTILSAIIVTIVGDLVIALSLYVVTKLIFRANSSMVQMFILTGSKAVAESFATVAGAILIFINPQIGLAIIVLGTVLGLLYLLGGYFKTVNMNENKRIYALFFTFIIVLIINGLVLGSFGSTVMQRFGSMF